MSRPFYAGILSNTNYIKDILSSGLSIQGMGKSLTTAHVALDIRLNGLFCSIQNKAFWPPWRSDLGGTRPRMVEGRIMQAQLSRAEQDARAENND